MKDSYEELSSVFLKWQVQIVQSSLNTKKIKRKRLQCLEIVQNGLTNDLSRVIRGRVINKTVKLKNEHDMLQVISVRYKL